MTAAKSLSRPSTYLLFSQHIFDSYKSSSYWVHASYFLVLDLTLTTRLRQYLSPLPFPARVVLAFLSLLPPILPQQQQAYSRTAAVVPGENDGTSAWAFWQFEKRISFAEPLGAAYEQRIRASKQ
jgi:hypothetical protein